MLPVVKTFHQGKTQLGKNNAKILTRNEIEGKIKYPTSGELTNTFNNLAKKLYEKGEISKEELSGYLRH